MNHMLSRYLMTFAGAAMLVSGCSQAPAAAPQASPKVAAPADGNADTAGTNASTAPTFPKGTVLRVADQGAVVGNLRLPWDLSNAGEGLPFDVEWSVFAGGPPMIVAFQSGAVDVGWVADAPPINAQAAGQDVVIVASLNSVGQGQRHLVSAPNTTLTSLADLRGKKVAVQKSTSTHSFVAKALSEAGLTLGKDVELVDIPNANVQPALISGSVDAGAIQSPEFDNYVSRNPTARELRDDVGLATGKEWLISSRKSLEDPVKVAAIGEFIQRLGNARYWAKSHPDTWIEERYVKAYSIDLPLGRKLYEAAGAQLLEPIEPPVIKVQQGLADLLLEAEIINKPVDVSATFDNRYNAIVQKVIAAHGNDTAVAISLASR